MTRKPKPQKTAPQPAAGLDLFADPAPPPRRPGRKSNHEKTGQAREPRKAQNQKKADKVTYGGTDPANIDNLINLEDMISKDDIPALLDNIEEIVKGLESKEKLTPQELKFTEYHLVLDFPVIKSMKSAGYDFNSDGTYFYQAKKIIGKFEARAEDHRNIMRALGAGEVYIVNSMLLLSKKAKSEIVRKAALDSLAKWIGIDKEVLQGNQGVTVIIQAAGDAQAQVNIAGGPGEAGGPGPLPGPNQPPYQHPQPRIMGKPVVILD